METRCTEKPCPNCRRLQSCKVNALQIKFDSVSSELTALRTKTLPLPARIPPTSSKPPSSDIVKPKPALEDGAKRSIGGQQPGHPKHERQPLPCRTNHSLRGASLSKSIPRCGGPVHRNADLARIVTAAGGSSRKPPLTIEQHTFPEYWCPQRAASRSERFAALPHIASRRLGRQGIDRHLIAFMKGVCHASYSTVRIFLLVTSSA